MTGDSRRERIVIHRRGSFTVTIPATGAPFEVTGRWFEYDGRIFMVGGGVEGNKGYGYTVDDLVSGETVGDGYDGLWHIRDRFPSDYRTWTPPEERTDATHF